MRAERDIIPMPAGAANATTAAGHPTTFAAQGGDFLFISGLTAIDLATGAPMRGTTASETRQILSNLERLLAQAGSSLEKVVKVNVLIHSMLEAPNMNEVYARFFGNPPPARTVCGARLPDGMKVIIECTALK